MFSNTARVTYLKYLSLQLDKRFWILCAITMFQTGSCWSKQKGIRERKVTIHYDSLFISEQFCPMFFFKYCSLLRGYLIFGWKHDLANWYFILKYLVLSSNIKKYCWLMNNEKWKSLYNTTNTHEKNHEWDIAIIMI